jgi:cytochrome oxidase Cu insertion factor (SCO1/SenC/PrrC family)
MDQDYSRYKLRQQERWEHDHPQAAKDKDHQYQKGYWHPLLGFEDIVDHDKKHVSLETLQGKYLAILFSAHWSKACTDFTTKLTEAYHEYNRSCPKSKTLEILFVSSDESEEDMWKYVTEWKMPWKILPYNDHRKNILMGKFHVGELPKLVVVDPRGNCLATDLVHESIVRDITNEGAIYFSKILGHVDVPSATSTM